MNIIELWEVMKEGLKGHPDDEPGALLDRIDQKLMAWNASKKGAPEEIARS